MEKKRYVAPWMGQEVMVDELPLCGSGVSGSGVDAGYGGIDTGGTKDPSAKGVSDFGEELSGWLW